MRHLVQQIKSYLHFLWESTNQHGVHSPFVFSLITKCLYSTDQFKVTDLLPFHTKKHKTIHRLLHYFNESNPEIVGFQQESKVTSIKVKYIDLDICIQNNIQIETLLDNSNNDTCFIFDHIHTNRFNECLWKSLAQHPAFTVTMDTYALGIAFIRTEQKKEHFVIRN